MASPKRTFYSPVISAISLDGWLRSYGNALNAADQRPIALNCIMADIIAGATVAITLVPQGLAYASLANLPPVYGLYSSIVPAVVYSIFGTSTSLNIGPVAIVSLLMGRLISEYSDTESDPSLTLDLAAQAAFCVGLLLCIMSILNLGQYIRYLSHSIMSGFTSAAAMLIGLSQLKNAFGFRVPIPQVGADVGYTENYHLMYWYVCNWNGHDNQTHRSVRNPYAFQILLGVYIPLICIYLVKNYPKWTNLMNKTWWYPHWIMMSNLAPLILLVFSACITRNMIINGRMDQNEDAMYIKIIGRVTQGLDLLRIPQFRYPMGQLCLDVFPMAVIGYMESYSIARNIAASKGELDSLHAGQELFAIGLGNMMGSCFSSYPVAGSFSRSSLNATAGGKTGLSGLITVCVIIFALTAISGWFYWIPTAALAAIVFVAITNIISVQDVVQAYRYSKPDCGVLVLTFLGTFFLETSKGLMIGVLASCFVLWYEGTWSWGAGNETPKSRMVTRLVRKMEPAGEKEDSRLLTSPDDPDAHPDPESQFRRLELEQILVGADMTFLTMPAMKDYILTRIASSPAGLILDWRGVRVVDWTALIELRECSEAARKRGVGLYMTSMCAGLTTLFHSYDISYATISVENEGSEVEDAYAYDARGQPSGTGIPVRSPSRGASAGNIAGSINSYGMNMSELVVERIRTPGLLIPGKDV